MSNFSNFSNLVIIFVKKRLFAPLKSHKKKKKSYWSGITVKCLHIESQYGENLKSYSWTLFYLTMMYFSYDQDFQNTVPLIKTLCSLYLHSQNLKCISGGPCCLPVNLKPACQLQKCHCIAFRRPMNLYSMAYWVKINLPEIMHKHWCQQEDTLRGRWMMPFLIKETNGDLKHWC